MWPSGRPLDYGFRNKMFESNHTVLNCVLELDINSQRIFYAHKKRRLSRCEQNID